MCEASSRNENRLGVTKLRRFFKNIFDITIYATPLFYLIAIFIKAFVV